MKNPLNKRFLRELRSEFGKYLVIFILLAGTIGFVSGFLVAGESMITAYNESFAKYNVEDGNFVLEKKANKYLREEIESQNVTLYENFYMEEALTNGSTMRIFRERKEVNLPCVMKGELPDAANEIAIDRMYADNNKIGVGDTLTVQITTRDGTVKDGKTYKISGLVALPDYSALFSDNSDMMFDAMMFGVGVVTEEAFAEFDSSRLVYDYVWKYNDTSSREMDNMVENDVTEDLMKFINSRASLKKFVPQFLTYENYPEDTVMIYGVEENSRYIDANLGDENAVYVSSAYADKYGAKEGDTLTFKETYEEDTYSFRVAGVYDYMGALAVFMDRTALNRVIDYDDDYFAGYFSENPINDIKDEYIGSVIDFDALNKTSRQLTISMGEMMGMVNAFAMVIFAVLLYLLGKIIIEKNAQSISITKILGYSNAEISGLYIVTTSVVVVLLLLVTLPVEAFILIRIFRIIIIQMMSGWMPLVIERRTFVQAFLMGVGIYAVVAVFEYRKVRKVPMSEALKNIE